MAPWLQQPERFPPAAAVRLLFDPDQREQEKANSREGPTGPFLERPRSLPNSRILNYLNLAIFRLTGGHAWANSNLSHVFKECILIYIDQASWPVQSILRAVLVFSFLSVVLGHLLTLMK